METVTETGYAALEGDNTVQRHVGKKDRKAREYTIVFSEQLYLVLRPN